MAKRKICMENIFVLTYEDIKDIEQKDFDKLPKPLRDKVRELLLKKYKSLVKQATELAAELERRAKNKASKTK